MLQMFKPTTRAKAKAKLAQAKMKWNWRLGKGKARKNWWQLRTRQKVKGNTLGVAGSIAGGMAALLAILAVGSSYRKRQRKPLAQKGQAPSRSHIQLSSHPAAQSRFQPMKKIFGGA